MTTTESPSALLRRLQRVSPIVRRAVVIAVGLGLITTAAVLAQAVALAHLLSGLFASRHAGLLHWSVVFLGGTVARAVALGVSEPATTRVAGPVRRQLRHDVLRLTLRSNQSHSADATIQLATRGIDSLELYIAKYVPALLLGSLAPLLLLTWLLATDRWSFSIVLVSVALLPLFMILLGLEAKDKMLERWNQQQQLAGYFGDVIRGMTVLKSFNRSKDAVANLDEVGATLTQTTMATLRVAFLSSFALELLSSLATALVALVLGLRLLNGSLELNVALAVLLVTPEVFLPLRRSAAQFHSSSDGIAAASDVLALLEGERSRGGVQVATTHELRLDALSLNAPNGQPLCAPVTGVIKPGALVMIEGASGAGKSTLLRLLGGLDETYQGEVFIGDVALRDLDLGWWHTKLGYLPQDPWLPGATVREVLAMGDSSIDDQKMTEALATAFLDTTLDREVGEGARGLSAGQRRRLALARCLVRGPQVLLLDEPTAHLDAENREVVERIISELPMTRIMATHHPFSSDVTLQLRPA